MLRSQKFTVVQREEGLESAMLDGALTAVLQVDGLRVGDTLESVSSLLRKQPKLRSETAASFPTIGSAGNYRLRVSWPKSRLIKWRVSPDLGDARVIEVGQDYVLEHAIQDPKAATPIDGAPARFNRLRQLEFSAYQSWSDVAGVMAPLYDASSRLAPDSPLKSEAAKIAALSSDPAVRSAAALRIVQDQIRYVYIGLNEGAYIPAAADETWRRRFGDCKAKTAVLLALLKELGVEAEPALVSSSDGDGLDQRLPRLGLFDHVLVRARIDGRTHWLDGTRTGDRDLAEIPVPVFLWALPIRVAVSGPERIEPEPLALPASSLLLEIDASRGREAPATVSAEQMLRGDNAVTMKTGLSAMTAEDAVAALKGFWAEVYDWIEPDKVSWRFDEAKQALALTMQGTGQMEWSTGEGSATTRWFEVSHSRLGKPDDYKRPKDQDQAVPFATDFPSHRRWVTTIKLPKEPGRTYDYKGLNVNETFGGRRYVRQTEIEDGVLRTVVSLITLKPEISAAEAAAARVKRLTFNTNPLWLYATDEPVAVGKAERENRAEQDAQGNPAKLLEVARGYARAAEYRKAVAVLDQALAEKPGDSQLIRAKAELFARSGDFDAALATLEPALKSHPEAGLYGLRGSILAHAKRDDASIATFREGAQRFPESVELHAALVDALASKGDVADALAAISAAEKLSGPSAHLHRQRASLLSRQGRRKEVWADLDQAVRLEPEHAVNFLNRGRWFARAGEYERAISDFDEALRIDPLYLEVYTARADALERLGRRQEAVATLDRAVERHPASARALNARCWTRALWGRQLPEAEADCEAALKLKPDAAGYIDSRALVAFRMGNFDEAVRLYDRALQLNPQQAMSLYGRGLAKLKRGDDSGRSDIAAAKAISARVDEELTSAGIVP